MLTSDLVQTDKHSIIILLRRKNLRFLRRTNHNTNSLATIKTEQTLKEKKVEYKVKDNANRLNEIIRTELKQKTLNKRINLSGEYSDEGGLDIFNTFSLLFTQPNLGPLVKLNLKSLSINIDETESKLTLKRVNGTTYNIQYWFILFFISLTLIISIYQIATKGFNDNLDFLFMPLFGVIYFLMIEFIAETTIRNLIKKIEKIMTIEQIEYKKL